MSDKQKYDVPGTHDMAATTPQHAAATATEIIPIFEAPASVKIEKVIFRPGAAVTGQDTNTTHLNVINMGTAGTGTTELGNYDLTSGNDLAVGERKELYAPATSLEVAAQTLIGLQLEKVGTGLDVPDGIVIVEFAPN